MSMSVSLYIKKINKINLEFTSLGYRYCKLYVASILSFKIYTFVKAFSSKFVISKICENPIFRLSNIEYWTILCIMRAY